MDYTNKEAINDKAKVFFVHLRIRKREDTHQLAKIFHWKWTFMEEGDWACAHQIKHYCAVCIAGKDLRTIWFSPVLKIFSDAPPLNTLGYPLQLLSQGYLQNSRMGQTGGNKQRQGWRGLVPRDEIWTEEEMLEWPSRQIPPVYLRRSEGDL